MPTLPSPGKNPVVPEHIKEWPWPQKTTNWATTTKGCENKAYNWRLKGKYKELESEEGLGSVTVLLWSKDLIWKACEEKAKKVISWDGLIQVKMIYIVLKWQHKSKILQDFSWQKSSMI